MAFRGVTFEILMRYFPRAVRALGGRRCPRLYSGWRLDDWRSYPDDVAVGISDHEIAVTPLAIARALQHLRSERLGTSKGDVYPGVDPELRLYGDRQAVRRLIPPEQVQSHLVAVQHRVHGNRVAGWIHDARLESEHLTVPLDCPRHVGDRVYRGYSRPP